ncbi:hypothetical protein IM40_07045 [Candidatus Paracaedimonas acanthamoebae]|nr:hypothetical protein IM40_07045 [Candidatus Paracaedimonas acanthamoebae]
MLENRKLLNDELQAYPPHGHPWACPKDLRQPEDAERRQDVFTLRERNGGKGEYRKVSKDP